MKKSEPEITAIVEHFLPVLVRAGDYALAIQPRIAGTGLKAGDNPWTQAITDADLSVQAYLEVETLSAFPSFGFHGEEHEQSRNAGYFDPAADTILWLDPINGTFLYKNQRPNWDIILSITRRGRLEAAISYQPARGRFNLALRGRGALTGDRHSSRLADCAPLRTITGSNVCLSYETPDLLARARTEFMAFDIVSDDDPARGPDNLNEMFTGRLDAYFSRKADLLDWGAMALIVTEAGGVASTPTGEPLRLFDEFGDGKTALVVSGDPAVHRRLLATFDGTGQS